MARFFLALGVDRLTTACLTICLSSSVYQLTNIYTRGAVTEFFAYQLMLLGAVVLLSVFAGEGPRRAASKLVLGFASLALGVLAHPPTFATAGLFLGLPAAVLGIGLVLPAAAASIRRQPLAWALVATTLVPVTLWLQIAIAQRAELGVTQQYSDFLYFPLSIDHWIARFWPFSIDLRVLTDGYNLVSTPFLSAPVNSMALLLAALALFGHYLRPLAGAPRNLTVHLFVAAVSLAIIAPLLLSLPIVRTEPVPGVAGAVRRHGPRPSRFHDRESAWPDPIRLPARQHREPGGDPGCARDFTSPIADESRSAGMASARPRVALPAGRRGDSIHCRDWQQGARRAPGVHLAAADQPTDHPPSTDGIRGWTIRKRSRPTVWRCARSTRFRPPSTASDCTECRESTGATSKAPIRTN